MKNLFKNTEFVFGVTDYKKLPKDIGNGILEKKANIQMNPNNTHVMICGNPAMSKDTTVELKKIGLKKHRRSSPGHITTENYW